MVNFLIIKAKALSSDEIEIIQRSYDDNPCLDSTAYIYPAIINAPRYWNKVREMDRYDSFHVGHVHKKTAVKYF